MTDDDWKEFFRQENFRIMSQIDWETFINLHSDDNNILYYWHIPDASLDSRIDPERIKYLRKRNPLMTVAKNLIHSFLRLKLRVSFRQFVSGVRFIELEMKEPNKYVHLIKKYFEEEKNEK